MFLFGRPSEETIRQYINAQRNSQFSYPEIGRSSGAPPEHYNVDHNRILLGHGEDCFQQACTAVRNWRMFQFDWFSLCWPDAPIETGTTVAILVNHLGFWSLNACRIVYLVDETDGDCRFGFAYGTLAGHVERGEERFTVEWNRQDDSVWYDLLAFSRPANAFARFAYPVSRYLQRRFARDSKQAMRESVICPSSPPPGFSHSV